MGDGEEWMPSPRGLGESEAMRLHRPKPFVGAPRVSVVIPCYRYGGYLPDAVASVLDQDGLDIDVLVVDDASPDDSAEVAHRLAAADPRVSVMVHERNAGHIQTYNDGLSRATGDYVVLLSADDLLPRNALTRAVALMEAHPRVGLVYGYARSFTEQPEPVHRHAPGAGRCGRGTTGCAVPRGRAGASCPAPRP